MWRWGSSSSGFSAGASPSCCRPKTRMLDLLQTLNWLEEFDTVRQCLSFFLVWSCDGLEASPECVSSLTWWQVGYCSPSATLEQTEAALVKGWMLWCRMPEGETFNIVVSQWINSLHLMFRFRYKIVVLGNVKSQNQAMGLVLYSVILAV